MYICTLISSRADETRFKHWPLLALGCLGDDLRPPAGHEIIKNMKSKNVVFTRYNML